MTSWGQRGKVDKAYGTSKSKRFDVTWDTGEAAIGLSTRAICLVVNLGSKPVSKAKGGKPAPVLSVSADDDPSDSEYEESEGSDVMDDEPPTIDDPDPVRFQFENFQFELIFR